MSPFSSLTTVLPRAVVVVLCLLRVEASVHVYAGERFVSKGNAFVVHGGSEGIYSSAPDLNESSSAFSFIRFEKIKFRRPLELSNFSSKSIHAIVFEVDDRETIGGSAYGGQRAVCCTADLAKLEACTEGEIIHRPSVNNPEGKSVWKNPTGYLPGRMAPLENFYGFMSLSFLMLSIFWFSQYARFWKEVLPLQNCITLVITLGMLEMALWYFDYVEFNKTGIRPTGITVWAVTFGAVKRTVSRLIILIVSMGYGVVRPTLGGLTYKVLLLGGTFFFASEVLELLENVGAVSDFSENARFFFVLPVAILDAFFILWIFTSLSSTLNKLQARRLTAKLDIYRKFTNALAVAVIVSVGWICYELHFKSKDVYNEQWQNAWIIPAFASLIILSIVRHLCSMGTISELNEIRLLF